MAFDKHPPAQRRRIKARIKRNKGTSHNTSHKRKAKK